MPEDFRRLARLFASCETDAEAHELFNTVFRLQPARHAHLAHPNEDEIPKDTSWHEAPPVKVPSHLRKTEKEYLGTIGKVREVRRKPQAQEPPAEFTTNGPIRLSRLQELDDDVFQQLLDLVGRALGNQPDDVGTRTASNGSVEITLREARGTATIETRNGTFHSPDFLIDIRSAP